MTREDIIAMAIEVYGSFHEDDFKFANLVDSAVQAKEREFYMQLFLDPENQPTQFGTATQEYREQEVREAKQQERHEFKEHALAMARAAIIGAVKNEREACAKVCDEYDVAEDVNSCDTAEGIAIAIRARSNHDNT